MVWMYISTNTIFIFIAKDSLCIVGLKGNKFLYQTRFMYYVKVYSIIHFYNDTEKAVWSKNNA